jgi:ferric enterobactin receptor
MQNKHFIFTFLLFFFLVIFNIEGLSQKLITYKVENQPLNLVLTKISSISKVRFAFDDDYFSKINVSFNLANLTVDEFLKQICLKFPIAYKYIGGTWVVYKDEKKVVERPRPKVEQKTPIKQILIPRKITYKKSRLWELIGTVIDGKSGNRLKFCQLFIDEYTNPVTNEYGLFSDEIVSTGEVRIKVKQIGYYPLDTAFMMSDGKDIVLKLNPIWKIENAYNDSYTGIFPVDFPKSSDLIALNSQSGTYVPGIEENDFTNSLKLLSGIYLSGDNNAGLSFRGISPSENLIMMDGIPVLNYSHLDGQISGLNSKFINQAFIMRGGFGAEYGGSSSGIIDLSGKTVQNKSFVDFTANMLDVNLFMGIPINNQISVSGSVRKSVVDYWPNYYYQNIVKAPFIFDSVDTELKKGKTYNPYNSFLDINLKVSFKPDIRNEINFILTNGYDNQIRNLNFSSGKNYFMNFKSNWRNYGLGLNWKFRSKNSWYNTLNISYNTLKQNNGFESGYQSGENAEFGFIKTYLDINNSQEIALKWKSKFTVKNISHQFGAEYTFNQLNYNYHFSDYRSIDIGERNRDSISNLSNKQLFNLFYQGQYTFLKKFDLTFGIRSLIDLNSPKVFLQPRVGLDFKPDNNWKFYYRFGRYIQPFYQTQRFGSNLNTVQVWMLPSNSDHFIKSFHHIAGGNFNNEGFLMNIESYLINSSGKSAYFTSENKDENTSGEQFGIYTGNESFMGVDATFQFHHNIFNHSVAYSYSDNKEKFIGINNDHSYSSINGPHHRLQLSETVAYSGWIATAVFKYFSGRPYLLQNSTIKQFNFSQLQGFSQLDFSLVKQLSINTVNIEMGLVLLNILGKNNEKNIQFFQLGDSTSNLTIKSTSSGIPFTPTFFITIKFD